MAKTRGGLSTSPSLPMPRPTQSAIRDATLPDAQDSTVPPSEGGTPSQCRAKFSAPEEPSQPPQAEPPTEDSHIPVGIPLETIIRRPMIARPPIEGNLDCRDRSFHLETWFDIDALR
ncbi:hypothetical protein CK203_101452 [Vitis vinifera]|uniref:Uncharacterized protein n=1 Tax=Vitis vinifera TaxID=29760 RepID=A0A438BRD8_VITVI|nr:hypothetical protein CK203_101452 [Vitis vinifera]